jgi:hypothetical protein
MQRFLREGKLSSSPGTCGVDTNNPDKASSPGKQALLGRSEGVDTSPPGPVISESSEPSTSTSLDQDSLSGITTDSSTGDSGHRTTQSLESWQTQIQHLYAILDTFRFQFDSQLEVLRAGIPLSSQHTPIETAYPLISRQSLDRLAHDWRKLQETSQTAFLKLRSDLQRLASSTTAVAVEVNSLHTSARNTDDSDSDDDKDGNAAVQPSPSHSLMGFFEPFLQRPNPSNLQTLSHHVAGRDWDHRSHLMLLLRSLRLLLLRTQLLWVHSRACFGCRPSRLLLSSTETMGLHRLSMATTMTELHSQATTTHGRTTLQWQMLRHRKQER